MSDDRGARARTGTVVRRAQPDDAPALLALQHRLDAQSGFMLLEPGERERSPLRLAERLAGHTDEGSFDLVAAGAGTLSGWLSVEVLPYRRAARTGYVVLGVDAPAAGRGVGRGLLAAAGSEARRRGLHRLELTVMTDNLRAVALYLSTGFEVEGLRRRALHRDGRPVDEYYMALLLER
ncbi:N-acetyltransferase family protein [Geodermatophilus sp. SYSU D00815]